MIEYGNKLFYVAHSHWNGGNYRGYEEESRVSKSDKMKKVMGGNSRRLGTMCAGFSGDWVLRVGDANI